jgi:hypothetical protein
MEVVMMRFVFAALLLLVSVTCTAQPQQLSPYVFASAGVTNSSANCQSLTQGGSFCPDDDPTDTPFSWRIGVGVQHGIFGVEFAYQSFGTYLSWGGRYQVAITQSTESFILTPTVRWRNGSVGAMVRAGAAFWWSDVSFDMGLGSDSLRLSGTSPTAGFGAEWYATDKVVLTASIDWVWSVGTSRGIVSPSVGSSLQAARVNLWSPSIGVRIIF